MRSKQRLAEGGFNLRKFVTNSLTLKARVQKSEAGFVHKKPEISGQTTMDDRSYSKIALGSDSRAHTEGQKVLEVHWNVNKDQFKLDLLDLGSVAQDMDVPNPTKGDVVSITAKYFDPLGVICPVTIIQFKILFQEMCKLKINWDEQLMGGALE